MKAMAIAKGARRSEICRLLMLAGFCLALISMEIYGYIMNNQKGLLCNKI